MNPSNAHRYTSYQQGAGYAQQQTETLEDTTKAYYQADETALAVMQQMTAQRQQLQGAHGHVWEMRETTEKAKRELQELHSKYIQKKQRLYVTIAVLAVADTLLFFRILQCRGSFFC